MAQSGKVEVVLEVDGPDSVQLHVFKDRASVGQCHLSLHVLLQMIAMQLKDNFSDSKD